MTTLILESVNLFCGDDNPTNSNHLRLLELKLPEINENYVEHAAGGAPVAISIDTHIDPLEATFTMMGWQPEIYTFLKRSGGHHNYSRNGSIYEFEGRPRYQGLQPTFTAWGLLREQAKGCAYAARAVMRGMLGQIKSTPFHRGELQVHEYAIRGITYYDLEVGGREVFHWDFYDKRAPRVIESTDMWAFLESMVLR